MQPLFAPQWIGWKGPVIRPIIFVHFYSIHGKMPYVEQTGQGETLLLNILGAMVVVVVQIQQRCQQC